MGVVVALVLLLAGGDAAAAASVADTLSQVPGSGVAAGEPTVALTFDDGPSPYTSQVLDILARYGVPATFFVIGRQAATAPDLVRRTAAAGHAIGNHTWDHHELPGLSASAFAAEIDRTTDLLRSITGRAPPCVRPPGGAVDGATVSRLGDRGLTAVNWNVDPRDWARPGSPIIAARVLGAVRPGSIVVLHDGGGDRSETVAALPAIIEGLQARGYRFAAACGTGTDSALTNRPVRALGASFGSATAVPAPSPFVANRPIVGMAASPSGGGYWLAGSDGAVFSFGDARFFGSMGGTVLNRPVVGVSVSPSAGGYWLVASDGGVFAFGDARFFGSTGGMALHRPIVGMAATPTGGGYWLVASDGGVFSFGDAGFFGSTGGMAVNRPIVGMAATPTGHGYWLVASDGAVFSFGDAAFFGSTGGMVLNRPVVGMAATPTGSGYWLAASDGGVFSFGDAQSFGSPAGGDPTARWAAFAPAPAGGGYWLAANVPL